MPLHCVFLNDADDLVPGAPLIPGHVETHAPADRVTTTQHALYERLVHHHHVAVAVEIAGQETTTRSDRQVHRTEEIRIDRRRLYPGRRCYIFDLDVLDVVLATRQVAGEGHAGHAGYRQQPSL